MKTRKNKKLLVVVAMVLMIGLVAGMGAMTYSKYITTSSVPAQTATAAKWNYFISANVTNLFGTQYKEGNADTVATTNEDGTVVVRSASSANIVAPGTSGSMTITVGGESEVLAQFKVSINATSEIGFGGYYPIKWKFDDTTYDNISDLNAELSALTAKAAWDTNAFKFTATTYTISWEWPLETGANADEKANNNVRDTVIGMKANNDALAYDSIKELFVGTKTIKSVLGEYFDMSTVKTTLVFTLTATIEQVQA